MNRVLFAAFCVLMALPASAQRTPAVDSFRTSGGDLTITCIGHGSLMFTFGKKTIHVDPVSSMGDYSTLPKADLILITHEHGDHLDAKAIQAISTAQTTIIANPGSSEALPSATILRNGEAKTVAGFSIEAVPSYNPAKAFHPKGNGNGYVITFADTRVYVAGDTEYVPEMKDLKAIDIAFLPMNLPYTMTPEQVADAARAFRPKVLYPYHFGNSDTSALVALLKDEKGIEVRIRDMK